MTGGFSTSPVTAFPIAAFPIPTLPVATFPVAGTVVRWSFSRGQPCRHWPTNSVRDSQSVRRIERPPPIEPHDQRFCAMKDDAEGMPCRHPNRLLPPVSRRSALRWLLGGSIATGVLSPAAWSQSPTRAPLRSSPPHPPAPHPPATRPPATGHPNVRPQPNGPVITDDATALASVRFLANVALRHVPQRFEGDRHWGDTRKVWSGVKVKIDGGRLRTHRRFREVEHGRWIRYQVQLPPQGLSLDDSVQIRKVDLIPSETSPRYRIDATAITPANYQVRIQRWNRGVRIASVTVEGDLKIRLDTTLDVQLSADYAEIPPAMQIDPTVVSAKLTLEKFRVDRVSRIGGDAAELWGEVIQELFVERLIKKQNDRLAEKLNEGIQNHRDDLRLSTMDWIRKGFSGTVD